MKQSPKLKLDPYCSELSRYNKTHRLIGNVSCETLVRESLAAIQNSMPELKGRTVMVDIGAGSGVLGYAWLLANESNRVVFLEPDRKAVAFLHLFFSIDKRTKVLGKRLEDLKLEDLVSFEPVQEKILLASRAFSSNESLVSCYEKSQLSIPLFAFEKTPDSFSMLRKG